MMTNDRNYFDVVADPFAADRWFLDEPTTTTGGALDPRLFISGAVYKGPPPARVRVSVKGSVQAFNFGAFDMPIVSYDVAEVFKKHAGTSVQLFPVSVSNGSKGFFVLNVTRAIECVDEERSEAMKWAPEDGRPDKVGLYRMITILAIDPIRAERQRVFRIKGWEIALIVSECVHDELGQIPNLGVVFQRVT